MQATCRSVLDSHTLLSHIYTRTAPGKPYILFTERHSLNKYNKLNLLYTTSCLPAGYLSVSASNALLSHIYKHTAPGSRIAITAPPSTEERARSATYAPTATTPACGPGGDGGIAAASESTTNTDGIDSNINNGSGNASVPGLKLYHHTFEEPGETLER